MCSSASRRRWAPAGTNPEQLFAVGYAACFESALGVVGRREPAEVGDVSIDSRVSLLPTAERGLSLRWSST
jgi:organic hydroperoxide reductase OsmC/OhrA